MQTPTFPFLPLTCSEAVSCSSSIRERMSDSRAVPRAGTAKRDPGTTDSPPNAGEKWDHVGGTADRRPLVTDGGVEPDTDQPLVELLPDGIIVIDGSERIVSANAATVEAFSARRADVVGSELEDLVESDVIPAAYLERYRDTVDRLQAASSASATFEFTVSSGGDTRTYEARHELRPDVTSGGTVGTIREITDRAGREDEIERYETLLRTMPDTVVVTDTDGHHIDIHGFEGWSGYDREELVGAHVSTTTPDTYLEKSAEVLGNLFREDDREKATFETEIETKDGERIPMENHITLLPPDENGWIPGSMSVLRDISDRKEQEQQLNALNETMQALIVAESPRDVAERVVETARDVLGFDINTVAFHDEATGQLVPVASSQEAKSLLGELPPFEAGESLAWDVFETGEISTFEDLQAVEKLHNPETPIRSEIICPLGEYGVLLLGSTTPGEFDDRQVSLVEILSGNVEAALDRAFYLEELEERERELEIYETAVEASSDGIAIMSEDAEFRLVNSQFADATGVSKHDIEGTTVTDVENEDVILDAPADLREQWIDAGETARAEGRHSFEYESTVELEYGIATVENRVTAIQQNDGSVIYVLVMRDITDRVEREEQIEGLHESTRRLMEADSTEAVARRVGAAVETTLGFAANLVRLADEDAGTLEPVAVSDQASELLEDPSPVDIDDHPLGEAFRTGEPLRYDDIQAETGAYEDSDLRSVLSLPIGEYGLVSLVSDQVGAYDAADTQIAEILTANAERAFERVEREEALRDREAALSRQIERLDEFASIVSHDLRNPLNVAKGRLVLLEEEGGDSEHIAPIERSLDRMDDITTDVLALAREGDEATHLVPVHLPAAVEACWRNVDTASASLEIETERTILADKGRLQQLFENLMRNALDHGGPEVVVRVGTIDGGFYVEDDGPGIPTADREAVFDASYSTTSTGTGLGLHIVKTIADAHGWDVTVTESPAGGARFEFSGIEIADR